jgi:hypothetical protein
VNSEATAPAAPPARRFKFATIQKMWEGLQTVRRDDPSEALIVRDGLQSLAPASEGMSSPAVSLYLRLLSARAGRPVGLITFGARNPAPSVPPADGLYVVNLTDEPPHWVAVSLEPGTIVVRDSSEAFEQEHAGLARGLGRARVEEEPAPQQRGNTECGIYALEIARRLAIPSEGHIPDEWSPAQARWGGGSAPS